MALTLTTGLAFGEEPRRADPKVEDAAARPVLVLLVAKGGSSPLEERAAALIAAHVRSAGVTLKRVERPVSSPDAGERIPDARVVAGDEGAKGVLWAGIGPQGAFVLYLLEKEGGRVFRRDVPAPTGQTSAALEALANIAGSAAAELVIEGHVVTMASLESADDASPPAPGVEAAAPAPLPPPEPPPAPPPAAPEVAPALAPAPPEGPAGPRWRSLLLAAGYTGGTFAREASWQNAIALSAWWAPAPDARVGLGYEVLFEEHVEQAGFDVDLSRHPIVLSGGYRFHFGGDRWDVDLGARSTIDIVLRTPHPAPSVETPATPLRHTVDALVSLAPTVGLGFRIVDRLRIGAWAGVDVPLNRLSMTNQPKVDLQTAPARFLGGLDLQVDLIESTIPRPARAGR
ncbi:hypothetical protein [Polyangium fumosum]|uniref:Uncharacterized protein n=1 Tax=Polyangium fumosum TaxID=889272 RepID=A0A4U1J054_9BACT|nr:hypothetical protein [Polyangium fumosum]TKD00286.1 hypothetical protein E8A74_34855 [Polyangium fumosum]